MNASVLYPLFSNLYFLKKEVNRRSEKNMRGCRLRRLRCLYGRLFFRRLGGFASLSAEAVGGTERRL